MSVDVTDAEPATGASDMARETTSSAPMTAQTAVTPTPAGAAARWLSRETAVVLPLLLILLAGAYFRFTGLDWDGQQHLHPDERFLTIVANKLQAEYNPFTYLRTSESNLNPYNKGENSFVYGNFPMTVTRLVAEWVTGLCTTGTPAGPPDPAGRCDHVYTAYDGIHLVGRFLSGLVDLVSILFTFLIARRLYGRRAGLLAALLLALAVLPIQQSHFFTMDNWSAALTTLSMYAAVRAAGLGDTDAAGRFHKRWWLLFGIGLGLAVASRINVAPLALMAVVAAVIWFARRRQDEPGVAWGALFARHGAHIQLVVVLAAVTSMLVFRLAQPYAFADGPLILQNLGLRAAIDPAAEPALTPPPVHAGQIIRAAGDLLGQKMAEAEVEGSRLAAVQAIPDWLAAIFFNPRWLSNMEEIQRLQTPEAFFPPALQWTDRAPILFPLINMLLYGMGPLAGLVAWAGFLWALWRIARGRPDWMHHALPVAWVGLYFLFVGTRWVKSIRYFLPIYPLLFVLGGWALVELWHRVQGSSLAGRRWRQTAVGAFIGLTILASALWANAFIQIYQQPVTRVAASHWIYDNIPSGATLLYTVEGSPQTVQLPLKGYQFEPDGPPLNLSFEVPADGLVTAVRFNKLSDPTAFEGQAGDGREQTLQLRLQAAFSDQPLAEGTATVTLDAQERAATIDLPGVPVTAGSRYNLSVSVGPGGPLLAGTSILINEHWDDPLPLRFPGRDGFHQYYSGVAEGVIPITGIDDEQKRQDFYHWLEEADYIVLSSQRALWHVPRLPLTFPMTTRYYEALFSGELGFDLVHQAHANIRIGPLYISDTGGKLGWGAPPEIGWPPPNDLAAEEAFSVYDHPPVWIFARSDAYSPERVREILGSVNLDLVTVTNPGEASQAPNALMLSTEEAAVQQTNGTFSQIFKISGLLSTRPWLAAVAWWAAVILLGWLAFPLCFAIFHGLPDRGFALGRILALLLISYFAWINGSLRLLPHTRGTLALGLVLLILLSSVIFLRRRVEISAFLRRNLALVGFMELLGLGLFLLHIGIRLGNPDLWDVIWGGEKPMDLAYFNAVLKSTIFPPYDPWFAGGYINYYYYGFVYVGSLTRLLGIVPAVAYNLILPMLFSFTGLGAFSLAYNVVAWGQERAGMTGESGAPSQSPANQSLRSLVDRLKTKAVAAGLMAMMLCVILGNLAQVGVLLGAWQRTSDRNINSGIGLVNDVVRTADGAVDVLVRGRSPNIYPGDWFWTATRTLNFRPGEAGPITEFPFFTFLYGDLHAHMISLPLTILALSWAISLALAQPAVSAPTGWRRFESALRWLIGGLAIGVLQATNTWDWPTYLVIGALAVAYHVYRQHGRLRLVTAGQALLQIAALAAISYLLFLPYAANYGSGYTSLSLWDGSNTYVGSYLRIYGLFLFLVLTHIGREFRAWTGSWNERGLAAWERLARPVILSLLLYVVVILLMVIRGYWIAPSVLTLIVAAGLLGLRPGLPPYRRVALILISAALGLTLFVEIFVLDGDVGRMNTVFKFYMQAWVLLSVAGGIAFAMAWPAAGQWHRRGRRIWTAALITLLLAAALYPLLATRAKWATRMSDDAPYTLDGMAFMATTSYDEQQKRIELAPDYDALRWMQQNIAGSPVVAEAHSPSSGYSPYRSTVNRVSVYTGLPAVIGWDWHQRQQRAILPELLVRTRIHDINSLYNTTDSAQAMTIIDRYNIKYVYAGPLEWIYYQPEGLLKFDRMVESGLLREVYRSSEVSIYEVTQ